MITNLLDSIELKFNSDYPKWGRVVQQESNDPYFTDTKRVPNFSVEWKNFISKYSNDKLELVKNINKNINKIPYKQDMRNYNLKDYWCSPKEFFIKDSGDCEDYAIAKYFALKSSGFSIDDLRITLVKNILTEEEHALCAVSIGNTNYILDNLIDDVFPDVFICFKKYVPVKSMNEKNIFIHISKKK